MTFGFFRMPKYKLLLVGMISLCCQNGSAADLGTCALFDNLTLAPRLPGNMRALYTHIAEQSQRGPNHFQLLTQSDDKGARRVVIITGDNNLQGQYEHGVAGDIVTLARTLTGDRERGHPLRMRTEKTKAMAVCDAVKCFLHWVPVAFLVGGLGGISLDPSHSPPLASLAAALGLLGTFLSAGTAYDRMLDGFNPQNVLRRQPTSFAHIREDIVSEINKNVGDPGNDVAVTIVAVGGDASIMARAFERDGLKPATLEDLTRALVMKQSALPNTYPRSIIDYPDLKLGRAMPEDIEAIKAIHSDRTSSISEPELLEFLQNNNVFAIRSGANLVGYITLTANANMVSIEDFAFNNLSAVPIVRAIFQTLQSFPEIKNGPSNVVYLVPDTLPYEFLGALKSAGFKMERQVPDDGDRSFYKFVLQR